MSRGGFQPIKIIRQYNVCGVKHWTKVQSLTALD